MDYNSGYDDAPETPAPLFALKAFRHAIFGTPKADENATRSKQTRASTLPVRSGRRSMDLASSPTKGILVTPGTSASKRKTVTFGAHQDKQERLRFGTTPQAPGAFPSIFAKEERKNKPRTDPKKETATSDVNQGDDRQSPNRASLGSGTRTRRADADTTGDYDVTTDMSDPRSASGKYWKTEFDSFSSKSATEIKKLAKKEKLAKAFAKTKDDEALELQAQLKYERRKVEDLEKRLAEYESRLSQSITGARQKRIDDESVDVFGPEKPASRGSIRNNRTRSRYAASTEETDKGPGSRAISADPKSSSLFEEAPPSNLGEERGEDNVNPNQRRDVEPGFPSSDIWADIGHTSEAAAENSRPDPPRAASTDGPSGAAPSLAGPARRPLRQRSANSDTQKAEVPEAKAAGRISQERPGQASSTSHGRSAKATLPSQERPRKASSTAGQRDISGERGEAARKRVEAKRRLKGQTNH